MTKMKKWLANVLLGVLMLLSICGFSACNDSNKTGTAATSANGTYYLYSGRYVEEDYITLSSGKVTAVFDGGKYQGTYTISGTTFTVTFTYDGEKETETGKIANGVIYLWDGYYCKKGCVPSDIDKTTGIGNVGTASLQGRYYWYNGNGNYEDGSAPSYYTVYIDVKKDGTCVLYDEDYGLTDGVYEINGDDITLNFGDGDEVIEAFYYNGVIEDYEGDFYCQKGYRPENENLHGRYQGSPYGGDFALNSKGTWKLSLFEERSGTYQISGTTITLTTLQIENPLTGETTTTNETVTGTIENGTIYAFDMTFEKVDMQFNG